MIDSAFEDELTAIASLKTGSQKALSYIFSNYHQKLFVYAYRFLKSKDLADEIVQETFLRIWDTRENIELNQSFDQYIFKISKNLILDSFRKLTREKNFEKEFISRIQLFTNYTEEEILYEELKLISEKAIEQMPNQQRLVFTLSRENGLSYKQIAEKLGISINTVKVHMLNSLNFLRSYLNHEVDLYLLLLMAEVTLA